MHNTKSMGLAIQWRSVNRHGQRWRRLAAGPTDPARKQSSVTLLLKAHQMAADWAVGQPNAVGLQGVHSEAMKQAGVMHTGAEQ